MPVTLPQCQAEARWLLESCKSADVASQPKADGRRVISDQPDAAVPSTTPLCAFCSPTAASWPRNSARRRSRKTPRLRLTSTICWPAAKTASKASANARYCCLAGVVAAASARRLPPPRSGTWSGFLPTRRCFGCAARRRAIGDRSRSRVKRQSR